MEGVASDRWNTKYEAECVTTVVLIEIDESFLFFHFCH
jgi:hypothetical protein